MSQKETALCKDGCKGCNVMNAALIVPIHQMNEEDFKKLGINYWSSDFSDIFSNGT
ncbi:MAG: hypothetical protein LUP95_06870 [Euryarchaeota archaeon]|nr:hypothetical protein [Euryarchaeota archaeon]